MSTVIDLRYLVQEGVYVVIMTDALKTRNSDVRHRTTHVIPI